MGNSSINGPFSMGMLKNQRVNLSKLEQINSISYSEKVSMTMYPNTSLVAGECTWNEQHHDFPGPCKVTCRIVYSSQFKAAHLQTEKVFRFIYTFIYIYIYA